ncbi:nucleolin [Ditylenchus destructor]|nr:nucleolin [Ditylenchus destructor]
MNRGGSPGRGGFRGDRFGGSSDRGGSPGRGGFRGGRFGGSPGRGGTPGRGGSSGRGGTPGRGGSSGRGGFNKQGDRNRDSGNFQVKGEYTPKSGANHTPMVTEKSSMNTSNGQRSNKKGPIQKTPVKSGLKAAGDVDHSLKKKLLMNGDHDSDDEDDVDDEEGLEDEEVDDSDVMGEEGESDLEDEDEEEDSEEDEESDEGPIQKTPAKSALKAAGDADHSLQKKVKVAPAIASPAFTSKTPSTPYPAVKKESKTPVAKVTPVQKTPVAKVKQEPKVKSELKRKAVESPKKVEQPAAKQARVGDSKSIASEEERRREERNKKSLFLKGVNKNMKLSELKALHPDIAAVRTAGAHAWLIFSTEAACDKAYAAISKKKAEGKPIAVDFCGSKSKNKHEENKDHSKKGDRPVDPLQIVLSGIPKGTSTEQLQVLFPNAKNITLKSKFKNLNGMAFIKFDDEKHAKEAFDKGASLKVKSSPVDVYFARVLIPKADIVKSKAEKAVKKPEAPKKQEKKSEQPKKKAAPVKMEPKHRYPHLSSVLYLIPQRALLFMQLSHA